LDVTTFSLAGKPCVERNARVSDLTEEFAATTAEPSNTSPFSYQRAVAEQCLFNGQHVKPRHVLGRIDALQHDVDPTEIDEMRG